MLTFADWVPGPIQARLAATETCLLASSYEGEHGIVYSLSASSIPYEERRSFVHYVEPERVNERSIMIPSMLELAAVDGFAFVRTTFEVFRLTLPELDNRTQIERYSWDTGFERSLVSLGNGLIAYTISTAASAGVLKVIEAEPLECRYEIPLEQTASELVVIDKETFGVMLLPFREDSSREGEALRIETATGNIQSRVPFRFRSWQDAYIAAPSDDFRYHTLTCTDFCRAEDDPEFHTSYEESLLACWNPRPSES